MNSFTSGSAGGGCGRLLAFDDKKFSRTGTFMAVQAPEMLTLKMLQGSRAGLKDPASVLLSESVAKALFDRADPMNQLIRIDNKLIVKVTGVYQDLPYNTQFNDLTFIAPWELYVSSQEWVKEVKNQWGDNSFRIFVQLADNAKLDKVSVKIGNVLSNKFR